MAMRTKRQSASHRVNNAMDVRSFFSSFHSAEFMRIFRSTSCSRSHSIFIVMKIAKIRDFLAAEHQQQHQPIKTHQV